MAKVVVPFVFVLILAIVPVADAVTPVEDDNNPASEDDLYEVVNTMMGTFFTSSAELSTYEIECDGWWEEWDGDITITATYAGQDQELWWENSTNSGFILTRSTDGYDYTSVVFQTIGGDFYFKDITNGNTWYSRDDLNADGETHMVTYDMRTYEGDIFICAFEDVSGLGDQDYNDLVFKISSAAPTCIRPTAVAISKIIEILIPGSNRFTIKIENLSPYDIDVSQSVQWLGDVPSDTEVVLLDGSVTVPAGQSKVVYWPIFNVGSQAQPGDYPLDIIWTGTDSMGNPLQFTTDPTVRLVTGVTYGAPSLPRHGILVLTVLIAITGVCEIIRKNYLKSS
jgi:hypothetical protein